MADFDELDEILDKYDSLEMEEDNTSDHNELENSPCDMEEDFTDDGLDVSEDELSTLERKASDLDRSEADKSHISFGRKMCPTRHGCQGATDCDYSYGGYGK